MTGEDPPPKTLKQPTILSQTTIRQPAFFYLHLTLLSPSTLPTSTTYSSPSSISIDPLTFRTHLSSALQRFLGVTGSAIPIDILKCQGAEVWIRVPNEDGSVVLEALSGWVGEADNVGWRIRASGVWLGGLGMGDGRDIWD
jgi:ribonuclease P/MRP protein subunit POP8